MTFLELQNRIVQTRKARRGLKRPHTDYYPTAEDWNQEDFDKAVYKKALKAANDVIKFYEESGRLTNRDKVTVTIKQPT